ncbi:MAG: ABC transporter substrate-binding protein, partial [Alphaproteobacteria bacterium]|nr:ABC transporter substrate-binding protein [Alphaproteobacteria bacterium]
MKHLGWLAGAALAIVALGGAEAQQTPRKGGTIRMTAPYAASFGSLDPHTTPRAQDEIVGKALNRTLYNWNSAENKLELELAKSVSASTDGLVHTFKLRDDVYFHNGRKMTADDLIWSWTRLMESGKGYPGARYVRLIKGAVAVEKGEAKETVAVEKGEAKEIAGPMKGDDFTLEMTITDIVDPGFYFFDGTTAILPKEEVEKGNFASNPVSLGPFKFKEHIPGSRVVLERFDKFYKPGKPYADRIVIVLMSEAAARDVAFRNKEIDTSILGPAQYVAYRDDPQLKGGILEVAEMFTRSMRMNPDFKPFSDKRVRQAINHAIDTDLIVKRLVKDKAYRATSWLPLSSPSFDKNVKPYAFDPDKA